MHQIRLDVQALGLSRGGRPVFSEIAFGLAPGTALMLRGANGAGKSSLLMSLAGLLSPQTGAITVTGADPEAPPQGHLHYVGHDPAIKTGMSVSENLGFWADVLGGSPAAVDAALNAAGLGGLLDIDAALLSAGQTRRLALARLIAVSRPLWLLDEPTSALDAQGARWVGRLVSSHLSVGGLAVIATHLDIDVSGRVETLALGEATS